MIRSQLLSSIPRISHGFGDCDTPEPSSSLVLNQAFPVWKQTHGTQCIEVLHPGQRCGDCDGLFTREPQTPIGVRTADCVPILLAKKDGSQIAAVHAGWRGVLGEILFAQGLALQPWGNPSLSQWVAAVGPCISAARYQVSEELADQFSKKYPSIPEHSLFSDHRHLNLSAVVGFQLRQLGVREIDFLNECTFSATHPNGQFRFFSHRRDGKPGRQLSWIIRT